MAFLVPTADFDTALAYCRRLQGELANHVSDVRRLASNLEGIAKPHLPLLMSANAPIAPTTGSPMGRLVLNTQAYLGEVYERYLTLMQSLVHRWGFFQQGALPYGARLQVLADAVFTTEFSAIRSALYQGVGREVDAVANAHSISRLVALELHYSRNVTPEIGSIIADLVQARSARIARYCLCYLGGVSLLAIGVWLLVRGD